MRLEALTTPAVNTTAGTTKPGAVAEKASELSEDDVIQARVLSVGDGTASLRTADGALLHASLENGTMLSPGTNVYLLVRDSGSDITVMTPVNPGLDAMSATSQQISSDPLLNAIFDQLVSLGYEPTEEMMVTMNQLLAETPNITLQEAAFFAAQKLEPEPAILNAFRAIASGETDTASLLDKLSDASLTLAEVFIHEPAQSADTGAPTLYAVSPDTQIPVVITGDTVPELPTATPDNSAAPPEILTPAPEPAKLATAPPLSTANAMPEFGRWLLEALGSEALSNDTASTPALTGEALAGSPLLDGLSERSLVGMAESLNRIAVSMPKSSSEAELFENISKFTKELFVRLDGQDDVKLQERLKEVREELYIKLAYFRDAVASSGSAAKSVVLEQTQKTMDHLRLLNGLDQFVCVQIPVKLDDQNKNADLYIYKRKKNGTPRIDPENVKILLALDLTHMGKLETLIEILGRDVSLRFDVENDGVAGALRQNSAMLHQLLDSAGFKFAGSSFVIKKSDTTIETALLSLLESERGRGAMDMLI